MNTFGELKAAVQSAMSRNDVPDYVYSLTTAGINRDLRVLEMQASSTLTASSEATALPADFLSAVTVYLDADPRRELINASEQGQSVRHDNSGQPRWFSIQDGEIRLMPEPDGSYDILLRYTARLAAFTLDADTNDVLVNYPGVYFYGAMSHASAWAQDAEREATNWQLYASELMKARKADVDRRYRMPTVARSVYGYF